VGRRPGDAGHNQYGLDTVGYGSGIVNLIQTQGAAHDVEFPCAINIYQSMNYDGIDLYVTNLLTQTVGSNTVQVCAPVCAAARFPTDRGARMLECTQILTAFVLLCGLISAQSTTRPKFFDRARIQHGDSGVTVTANDSIPLFQALYALRLEYGWQINWEEAPCFSHFDLVDDTGPKWRAAHPDAKGVTRPAGGLFTATFPEPNSSDPDAERLVLARLIEEYNATANPGRYVLRVDPDGQLTVVGTEVKDETGALRETPPLLDTPLTIAKATRSVNETIESILTALQSVTGKKVLLGAISRSLFMTTQAATGGERTPARELLKQALASTKRPIQYDLGFNPDVPVYILNLSPAMKEETDGLGGQKLVPADRLAKP